MHPAYRPSSPRTPSRRPAIAALALLAALGLLAVAACGGGAAPEEVAAGQALFLKTCASCHGPDANGMPNLGKGLHDNVFVQARGERELLDFLKVGRRAADPLNTTGVDMPPRGGNPALTDQDLAKIILYVKSLQNGTGG